MYHVYLFLCVQLNCLPSEISEQVNSRREQDEYKRLLYRINPTKYRYVECVVYSDKTDGGIMLFCIPGNFQMA